MKTFTCGIVLLLLPTILSAQPLGLFPAVNDARSRSLGHTEVMTSVGSNAVFANPANLGLVTEPIFMAGGRIYWGSYKTEIFEMFYDDYKMEWKMHPKLTQFSFAMPLNSHHSTTKITLALGYNTYFDFGAVMYSKQSSSWGGDIMSEETTFTQRGGLNTLSPAIAFNFNGKFMLGLALHKSILEKNRYIAEYDNSPPPEYPEYYTKRYEEEHKGSAFFFTLGGRIKFGEKFTMGFIIFPGFRYDIADGEYTREYYDGSEESGVEENSGVSVLPHLGLGFSYSILPNLLLAAEYQTRPNYKSGSDYEPVDDNPFTGSCLRLGMEYQSTLAYRMGYFQDGVPQDIQWADDEEQKPLTGFTAGVGISLNDRINVDIFGEWAAYKYDTYIEDESYGENKLTFYTFGGMMTYLLK